MIFFAVIRQSIVNIEVLLVQFLVLAFTGVVWWLARRDVSSRPAPPAVPSNDTGELEQLCATLEALVTDLAGRLVVVERQVASPPARSPLQGAAEGQMQEGQMQEGRGDPAPTPLPVEAGSPRPLVLPGSASASFHVSAVVEPEPESASHTALYTLLDEGVTDPAEIVRRTGLGRGEVDLILSLRARRAL